MDGYSVITIDGGTLAGDWYVSSNLVQYLTEDLGNSGSSTIYLYRDISSSSSYNREYISINSLSTPVYHPASGNSSNITGYSIVSYSLPAQLYRYDRIYSPLLLMCLLVIAVTRIIGGKR